MPDEAYTDVGASVFLSVAVNCVSELHIRKLSTTAFSAGFDASDREPICRLLFQVAENHALLSVSFAPSETPSA